MKSLNRRTTLALFLVLVMFAMPTAVQAQDRGPGGSRTSNPTPMPTETVPSASADEPDRLDLAAMALDTLDMPAEFHLSYETYFDFEAVILLMVGEGLRGGLEDAGLQWFYQTNYVTPSGSSQFRAYVVQYASDDGAIAGFGLLENEDNFVPDAALTDEPAPGLGDGPSEITIGSLTETVPETGPTSIDITFRVGSVIAGVGMDTGEGIAIDRDLTMQLAVRLEERVRSVLSDQPIPMIDTTLPPRYIGLGPNWFTTNEGYWTMPDLYGGEVGADINDAFVSGYFRASTYDPNQTGGFPMPRAAIEVADFENELAALLLLSDMQNLRPAMATFTPITIEPVPGASVTLAWEFPNQFFENATTDSVRIVMLVGTSVVTVDIQGNGSPEEAEAAAVAIAAAQVACLQAETACEITSIPPELFVVPEQSTPSDPVG